MAEKKARRRQGTVLRGLGFAPSTKTVKRGGKSNGHDAAVSDERTAKRAERARMKALETATEKIGSIRVGEEAGLLNYLEDAVSTPAISHLLALKDLIDPDNLLSTWFKGYQFPLSDKFGAELHAICRDVVERLGLGAMNVEFSLSNDPTHNAFAVFNHAEGAPHYVVLNSGLVERLSPDELRFVVGHELGHLVFRHSILDRVVGVAYKEKDDIPPFLAGLLDLWRKLGEISADRVGLVAAGSVDPALSAMFKMSSGVSMGYLKMDARAYLEMVDTLLDDMRENGEHVAESHPANPVRVKALELFAASRLLKTYRRTGKGGTDNALEAALDSAINVVRKVPRNDKQQAEFEFLSLAGHIVLLADGSGSKLEHDFLMNVLAQYHFWPIAAMDRIHAEETPKEIKRRMSKVAKWIVANHPQDARGLFDWLVSLAARDGVFTPDGFNALVDIAQDDLKIPGPEAVEHLLSALGERFKPLC